MLLGALSTFGPLSMDLYLPGLPAMAADLAASASVAQLTITACLLGLAAGQLVAGPLSDALGRRPPLLVGLAVYAAASLLCALSPSVWVLLALRLVQGMAGAAGIVIARAMVRDIAGGAEAARVYAMLMLVTGIAPMLAPLAGGQLLHVTDWRGVFVALAAIGVALLVAAMLRAPETLPRQRRHVGGAATTRRAMRTLARDRSFLGYALCIGLAFTTVVAYLSGASFLLEEIHGLSPQVFGVIFAVNAAGMVGASQVSARLVRRTGPGPLLVAALVIGSAGGVAFLVAVVAGAGLAVLLPALFVVIATRGMVNPNAQALALAAHPDAAGTASGLIGVTQFGLGAAAAPLAGVAGAHSALPMAILIAGSALAALVVLGLHPSGPARRPPVVGPPGGLAEGAVWPTVPAAPIRSGESRSIRAEERGG